MCPGDGPMGRGQEPRGKASTWVCKLVASRTVTRGPQLAHTVSSRLSRVRMGPGPTVRHTGGLSRSQGTSPGGRRRTQVRARAPQASEPRPVAVGPAWLHRASRRFCGPCSFSRGAGAVPICLHLCPIPWGLYSPSLLPSPLSIPSFHTHCLLADVLADHRHCHRYQNL